MTGTEHFPGYDVLGRASRWDPVTAGVVLARLGPTPPLRFFTVDEEAVARPLLDRLLALDDDEPKIPVFELIDSRLSDGNTDGWRYEDMPEDGDAWHCSLHFLEEDASHQLRVRFCDASRDDQIKLLESIRTGEDWHGLPAGRVWSLWMRYACTAFYSHPSAWNEIGFGGPAYPTGYKNLGVDGREPWEVPARGGRE